MYVLSFGGFEVFMLCLSIYSYKIGNAVCSLPFIDNSVLVNKEKILMFNLTKKLREDLYILLSYSFDMFRLVFWKIAELLPMFLSNWIMTLPWIWVSKFFSLFCFGIKCMKQFWNMTWNFGFTFKSLEGLSDAAVKRIFLRITSIWSS